jgi:protein SCO1/2
MQLFKAYMYKRVPILLLVVAASGFMAGCHSKPAAKHYVLTGTIVSIDKNSKSLLVNGDEVKGFMAAMTMSYMVKDGNELNGLSAGDTIAADLIEQGDEYWLEHMKVTQKAGAPPPTKADFHMPSPGEEVPDFKLVNQSNRHIDLHQYRGKTVILTFIYTRCPFPDFCPRMSGQFAELNRQLAADPKLYAKTHLLSISFDPGYDTPKVLTEYGHHWAGEKPGVFDHWEFAVAASQDIPQIATFFGLTVIPEKDDVITHSLSTAVIAPDGKISRWYHGSDWQASDLLKDAEVTAGPAS